MNICHLQAEADYEAALRVASNLLHLDIALGTPDGDHLGVLTTLIEAYEAKHYPIRAPAYSRSP
ncbi:MAG TPA: hypothetical protein PKN64_06105 [Casimicrobium sp.]|jgi:HTH-type transcriptional regulator/antitoxin HigA|nr:hypothetical protein [Casimicrobium sp.]